MANQIKGLAFTALIVLVASAVGVGTVSAAGDTDLTVNGSSSLDVGEQETYTVVIADGGDGIGGYNYNVSLTNGSVANIVDVELGGNPDINDTEIGSDGNSALLDAGWIVGGMSGGSDIVIGTVTVEATTAGSTDLQVDSGASVIDPNADTYTITNRNAQTIDVTVEKPDFQVSNLNAPSSVMQGDNLSATATITNAGTAAGTQNVEFIFNGSVIGSQSISLAPGASQTVSLSANTSAFAAGQYSLTATAGNSQLSSQLMIADTDVSIEPANATTGVNQAQTFDIVLDNASDGTAGYEFTVELTNSTVASITGINTAGSPSLETVNISNNNDSAYVDAGYLGNPVSGSQPLTIASVTVETKTAGSTNLAFDSSPLITDANANQYVLGTINSSELSVTQSVTIPGQGPAKDPDGDGLFEDVNGDNQLNSIDAVVLYQNRNTPEVDNNKALFNFQDSDSVINSLDAVKLYQEVVSS